jgi:hypothetical protein
MPRSACMKDPTRDRIRGLPGNPLHANTDPSPAPCLPTQAHRQLVLLLWLRTFPRDRLGDANCQCSEKYSKQALTRAPCPACPHRHTIGLSCRLRTMGSAWGCKLASSQRGTASRQMLTQAPPPAHPHRRMRSAWLAYEERMMPQFKEEKPGLKMSQYKDMCWKQWQKAPENVSVCGCVHARWVVDMSVCMWGDEGSQGGAACVGWCKDMCCKQWAASSGRKLPQAGREVGNWLGTVGTVYGSFPSLWPGLQDRACDHVCHASYLMPSPCSLACNVLKLPACHACMHKAAGGSRGRRTALPRPCSLARLQWAEAVHLFCMSVLTLPACPACAQPLVAAAAAGLR